MFGITIVVIFDAKLYLGPPFTTPGSGQEEDKQILRKDVETVSEQVTVVAQQQGLYTIV